jgi:3-hydroxybutyryl-CoA dehydrogenase
VLAIMETLHDEYGDPRYRPAQVLRRLVRAGRLGRKSGAGFFDYGGEA